MQITNQIETPGFESDPYELISAEIYAPLYIEHVRSLTTGRRRLLFKDYFDKKRVMLSIPEDVLSYSTYYNRTAKEISVYAISRQSTEIRLYEIMMRKYLSILDIQPGSTLTVPPCAQTIKATALYLLLGCPDINDGAGRIHIYLRKVFFDATGPSLRSVTDFEGTLTRQAPMRLGSTDSLRKSL